MIYSKISILIEYLNFQVDVEDMVRTPVSTFVQVDVDLKNNFIKACWNLSDVSFRLIRSKMQALRFEQEMLVLLGNSVYSRVIDFNSVFDRSTSNDLKCVLRSPKQC